MACLSNLFCLVNACKHLKGVTTKLRKDSRIATAVLDSTSDIYNELIDRKRVDCIIHNDIRYITHGLQGRLTGTCGGSLSLLLLGFSLP